VIGAIVAFPAAIPAIKFGAGDLGSFFWLDLFMALASLSACQPWRSHFTHLLPRKGPPMKRLIAPGLFLSLIITTAFQAKAQTTIGPFAGAPSQYSVDVVTTPKSGTPFLIKKYVDGAKRRNEQETSNGELVVILRGDVNMMYTVLVAKRLYRVTRFDPKSIKSSDVFELAKEIGVIGERVGTETINGEVCDKYHFSSDAGKEQGSTRSSESHLPTSGFIWVSQSTHLPVRSETATAITVWQNLNLGPQEPSLFIPPADYKLID
jgi:hypothetical protein